MQALDVCAYNDAEAASILDFGGEVCIRRVAACVGEWVNYERWDERTSRSRTFNQILVGW
jgi:hypothetical protein